MKKFLQQFCKKKNYKKQRLKRYKKHVKNMNNQYKNNINPK